VGNGKRLAEIGMQHFSLLWITAVWALRTDPAQKLADESAAPTVSRPL
jgi:hypothetical protein